MLVLYVDDLFLTRSSPTMIEDDHQNLMVHFDMTNCSLLPYFLSFHIHQSSVGTLIF